MARLVSYRRTSGDVKESTSLLTQLRKIEMKCSLVDHTLVADFWDKESAETANKREGFQQALQHIYDDHADGLVVFKLDRFARSVLDGVRILNDFKERGKSLICVADPIDTTSPLGTAFFQMALVFGELERKTIAERCRDGVSARAAQNRYATGAAPFGWRAVKIDDVKQLVEDKKEQRIIIMIREMRETEKLSFRAIAKALTDAKVPPPYKNRKNKNSSAWNNVTARHIYLEDRKLANWALGGCTYNYLATEPN